MSADCNAISRGIRGWRVVASIVVMSLGGASAASADCADTPRNGWLPLARPFANGPGPGHGTDVHRRVRFADIDGDRKADYLLVEPGGGVRIWLNRGGDAGGGGFAYAGRLANGSGVAAERVGFADVDGDGKADYLEVTDAGGLDAWLNRGGDRFDNASFASGWEARPEFARGVDVPHLGLHIAEVSGDGRADFLIDLTGWGSLIAWFNEGGDAPGINGWMRQPGFFARGAIDSVGDPNATFFHLFLADISCDGRADYLSVSNNGAVRAFINEGGDSGGGGWRPLPGLYARGFPNPVVENLRFADLDGDGRADYLLVQSDGSVLAFMNQGGDPP